MKKYTAEVATLVALIVVGNTAPASAQLLGGGASSASRAAVDGDRVRSKVNQRARAQVQQRVNAQVQTRVQTKVQDRARSQVQARIQGQAERAANTAQRLADTANRNVRDARRSTNQGVRIDVGADVNGSAAGNSIQAHTNTRVGLNANARPRQVSEADLQAFDSIFGSFNPLRERSDSVATSDVQSTTGPRGRRHVDAPDEESAKNHGEVVSFNTHGDFVARLAIASRQRRAEISEMRDAAIASGDVGLLARADEMEARLDAFTKARATPRARSQRQTSARAVGHVRGETDQNGEAHAAGAIKGGVRIRNASTRQVDSPQASEN